MRPKLCTAIICTTNQAVYVDHIAIYAEKIIAETDEADEAEETDETDISGSGSRHSTCIWSMVLAAAAALAMLQA